MGEALLERWIESWDERIAGWIRHVDAGLPPGRCHFGIGDVRDRWLAAHPHIDRDEVERALPEPWAGDPLGPDLLGVSVSPNPGGAVPVQLHPDGSLVEAIRAGARYSELARRWRLAAETTTWWHRTATFFGRLARVRVSPRTPAVVGMGLLPWHSTGRGALEVDETAAAWLRREVFTPAREMAARGRLHLVRDGARHPVALASHPWVREALVRMGAVRLWAADEQRWRHPEIPWPRSFRGAPTRRVFELLRLPLSGGDLHLLATWAPGSNFPPGEAFDPLVRAILEQRA